MRVWRLKRWSRAVALVLLMVAIRPPHAASDDPGCSSWLDALSDRTAQPSVATGTARAPGVPEHCAICHWSRLLRSPLTPIGVIITVSTAARTLERSQPPAYVAPVHDHLPARAPPVSLA
jgi:hypothetical protein